MHIVSSSNLRKWYVIAICLIYEAAAVNGSDFAEPLVILTNRLGIKSFNITSLETHTLYSNGHHVFDVDVLWDAERPQLFWSDFENGSIYGATLRENGLEDLRAIVNHGITAAEGIAVDWLAHNLYWVESQYGWIEMINLESRWRSVVVTNLETPRAVAVDSRDGLLFWTTWSRLNPKIEKSSMTGRDRTTIVDIGELPNAGFPNGITIDYNTRRIYWIDAKSDSIYSTDYFGHYRENHLDRHRTIQLPFGLTFYDNGLFWVDAKLNTFNKVNVLNSSSAEVLYETYQSLFGVALLSPDYYPEGGQNPCENNFGCSHLCAIDAGGTAACVCPYLMVLDESGKTCSDLEDILLVSEFHKEGNDGFDVIFGLSLDSSAHPITLPILPPSHTEIIGLELDAAAKLVYWADGNTNAIWRASVVDSVVEKVFSTGFNRVTGFGADWQSDSLFYSVVGLQQGIHSCSVVDGSCKVVLKRTSEPYSLKLHAREKRLFWIEMSNDTHFIYSASLNGSNLVTVHQQDAHQAGMLLGFTIDQGNDSMYWISSETNDVVKLSPRGEIQTFSTPFTSSRVNAMIIEGENIVVGDQLGQIFTMNKITGYYTGEVYNCSGAVSMLRQIKLDKMPTGRCDPCRDDRCRGRCAALSTSSVGRPPSRSPNSTSALVLNSSCPLVCLNSGRCTSNNLNEHFCWCEKGYHGSNCQFHVCDDHCEHGKCLLDEDSQPVCFCGSDYFGDRCQHSFCAEFCLHGECERDDGTTVCSCFEGWSGPMCQQASRGAGNPEASSPHLCHLYCLNDGECFPPTDDAELPTCKCPSGYFGSRCESRFTEIVFRVMAFTFLVVVGVMIGLSAYYCYVLRFRGFQTRSLDVTAKRKPKKFGFHKITENDVTFARDNVEDSYRSAPFSRSMSPSQFGHMMVSYVKREEDCDVLLSDVEGSATSYESKRDLLV